MCANDVAVAPGRIVYTPWLNERGGIEADLTVTRLAADAYLVVTSAVSQNRDLHWLSATIPEAAHAFVTDVTSGYAVLALMGPESRAVLGELTSMPTLPTMRSRSGRRRRSRSATRSCARSISYVGELGFPVYIPTEFALPVFDVIAEAAGARLTFAGFHALDSLRLEKAYRHWGHDIGDEDTPLDAGLGFACAFDKPVPFIGRDALLAMKDGRRPNGWCSSGCRVPSPAVPRRADRHGRATDRPAHLGLLWPHARRRDRHGLGAPPGRGHQKLLGSARFSRSRSAASAIRPQPACILRSRGGAPAGVSRPRIAPEVRDRTRARRGC